MSTYYKPDLLNKPVFVVTENEDKDNYIIKKVILTCFDVEENSYWGHGLPELLEIRLSLTNKSAFENDYFEIQTDDGEYYDEKNIYFNFYTALDAAKKLIKKGEEEN